MYRINRCVFIVVVVAVVVVVVVVVVFLYTFIDKCLISRGHIRTT